jgi:molybdenum cofactor biosynthesis protein B
MAHLTQRNFQPLNIAVLTISDTRTFETDASGQTLADLLQTAGHVLIDRALVKDDIYQIRAHVSQWIADPKVQVVLMTGGTGFTARDNTPQAVAPLLDKQVDGFGELFRQVSLAEIGMSTLQSRALAGMSNGVLVVCWEQILVGQLDSRTGPCNFTPHLKPQDGIVPTACEARP